MPFGFVAASRGLLAACAFAGVIGMFGNARGAQAAPSPSPTATPSPDKVAETLFSEGKAAWRTRTDVPYLRYGALVRYLHNNHVFDNWWDVNVRTADGQMNLMRLVDVDEEHRRLSGIPFSIFGIKIFDTNPDSEAIRLEEPRIEPNANFGYYSKYGNERTSLDGSTPLPSASPSPEPAPSGTLAAPTPQAPDLRVIGTVEADARNYDITYAGVDQLRDGAADHLKLVPLHDPTYNRLRDLWLDRTTHRTMQLRVAGILQGEPYDKVDWTVYYVELGGRNYLQQVVADAPLKFGFDTTIPKFEIDLVDYHFPTDVPKYTFDKPFSI